MKHNRRIFVAIVVVVATLLLKLDVRSCQQDAQAATAKAKEVEDHLSMGIKLLGAGQLAEALNQFHAAIDLDATNYMSYYRRGTVLLAMGRFKQALADLNQVIQLKPDFTSARMQRANVLTKQGDFAAAIKDYEEILRSDQTNGEAKTKLDKIFTILNDLGVAKAHMASRTYGPAIEILTQLLETCPWSTELHEYRSDCFLNLGELNKAILDINALAKLIPDNTKAYYLLSELHYKLGDAELALK